MNPHGGRFRAAGCRAKAVYLHNTHTHTHTRDDYPVVLSSQAGAVSYWLCMHAGWITMRLAVTEPAVQMPDSIRSDRIRRGLLGPRPSLFLKYIFVLDRPLRD